MTKETINKLQEAVDILFGKGMTDAECLAREFESIYRAFAYNQVRLEDNSKMSNLEACDALFNLESLIEGLKGKYIQA